MKTRKVSQESLDPGFSLGKKMAMSDKFIWYLKVYFTKKAKL